MKQYFGKKDSVTPNQNTLLESNLPNSSKMNLKKSDEHTKQQRSQLLDYIGEEINSDEDNIVPKRKKKFQEVLLEEMKEDFVFNQTHVKLKLYCFVLFF